MTRLSVHRGFRGDAVGDGTELHREGAGVLRVVEVVEQDSFVVVVHGEAPQRLGQPGVNHLAAGIGGVMDRERVPVGADFVQPRRPVTAYGQRGEMRVHVDPGKEVIWCAEKISVSVHQGDQVVRPLELVGRTQALLPEPESLEPALHGVEAKKVARDVFDLVGSLPQPVEAAPQICYANTNAHLAHLWYQAVIYSPRHRRQSGTRR